MSRIAAIVIALLFLAAAGWWGFSRVDQNTEDNTERSEPANDAAREDTGPVESEPAADAVEAPDGLNPDTAATQPEAPVATPAPQDAELPPETGSQMAQETEAVAEAAIAAADARAEAEATARAERLAEDAAKAQIRQAISPLLNPASFSAPAIRQALAELPAAEDDLTGSARDKFVADVMAVLEEADAAQRQSTVTAERTDAPADRQEPSSSTEEHDEIEVAPPFDSSLYINRIEQLF